MDKPILPGSGILILTVAAILIPLAIRLLLKLEKRTRNLAPWWKAEQDCADIDEGFRCSV